jgi:hypothetical protein
MSIFNLNYLFYISLRNIKVFQRKRSFPKNIPLKKKKMVVINHPSTHFSRNFAKATLISVVSKSLSAHSIN